MAEKKEIKDMSIQELRDELKFYCSRRRTCSTCVLSVLHHTGDEAADHPDFESLNSRVMLDTFVALARGYLVWDDPTDQEGEHSNVPDQPTVPPMPEPVELPEAKVSELSVDVPNDMTVIMISGKKPTSMTVFYDQEGGGD